MHLPRRTIKRIAKCMTIGSHRRTRAQALIAAHVTNRRKHRISKEDAEKLKGYLAPLKILVPVDIEGLLEAVYVGPQQSKWFHDSVRAVLEHMAPRVELRQSDLDADPVF